MLKYWIIVQILLRKLVRELNGHNSKRRKRIERRRLIRRFDRAQEEIEAAYETRGGPRELYLYFLMRLISRRQELGLPPRGEKDFD